MLCARACVCESKWIILAKTSCFFLMQKAGFGFSFTSTLKFKCWANFQQVRPCWLQIQWRSRLFLSDWHVLFLELYYLLLICVHISSSTSFPFKMSSFTPFPLLELQCQMARVKCFSLKMTNASAWVHQKSFSFIEEFANSFHIIKHFQCNMSHSLRIDIRRTVSSDASSFVT